jgi:hypothetical protein
MGNQAAAQIHCENAMRHAAKAGKFNARFFGFDHPFLALVPLARALWLRGLSDQALKVAQQSIDEAMSQGHPTSVCLPSRIARQYSFGAAICKEPVSLSNNLSHLRGDIL